MKARADKKMKLSRGDPGDKRARECVPGHYFSPESILKGGFGTSEPSTGGGEERKPACEQSGGKMRNREPQRGR